MDKYSFLKKDEEHFLRDCKIVHFKSTGKGGQKKNKTSSAIRLIHNPTNLFVESSVNRQQIINKIDAIRKLRLKIALSLVNKANTWQGTYGLNYKNWDFPIMIGIIIDAFHFKNFSIKETSLFLGISQNILLKNISKNKELWDFINQEREKRTLKRLKLK